MTGFRSPREYFELTNEYERALIEHSIEDYHDNHGGSTSMPGL